MTCVGNFLKALKLYQFSSCDILQGVPSAQQAKAQATPPLWPRPQPSPPLQPCLKVGRAGQNHACALSFVASRAGAVKTYGNYGGPSAGYNYVRRLLRECAGVGRRDRRRPGERAVGVPPGSRFSALSSRRPRRPEPGTGGVKAGVAAGLLTLDSLPDLRPLKASGRSCPFWGPQFPHVR